MQNWKKVLRRWRKTDNFERRDGGFACAGCGAKIATDVPSAQIVCRYCGKEQPHPMPFEPGTEVMIQSFQGYELGCVVDANGPDAIRLSMTSHSRVARFDQVTPVRRDPAEYRFGTQVFTRGVSDGWNRAWIVRRSGSGTWTIREDWHRDPFFDRDVAEDGIRVPLLAKDRHCKHRTLLEVIEDGLERSIRLVLLGLLAAIVLAVLWSLVARAFR